MKVCIKRDLSITFDDKDCLKVIELEERGEKLKAGNVEYLRG